MALYDTYASPEERLRIGTTPTAPKTPASRELAPKQLGATSELSPNFIGGTIDPTTGNLIPGSTEQAKKGRQVTGYSSTGVLPPATPSSLLSQV